MIARTILLVLITLGALSASANGGKYTFDDDAFDHILEHSEEVIFSIDAEGVVNSNLHLTPAYESNRDAYVAAMLAGCFGWMGVHRWYLGTSWGTAIGYCFLGGCLFYVDFWVIVVDCVIKNHGTAAYEKNPKLFMWK